MTPPSVTVVIAAYDHAAFARQSVLSVTQQDYRGPIQLIVTDDASSDGSADVLDAALAEFSRDAERVYHTKNKGICATFNEALALATGEYICFLAADDWMRSDRIRLQVDSLRDNSAALSYSDMTIVDENGDPTGQLYGEIVPSEWEFTNTQNAFERLLLNNWIPAPSVMMRTACIREVGGYDERLTFEDQEMWLRLTDRWPLVHVPHPLVSYRQVDTSLWNTLLTERAKEKHESIMLMLRRHRPAGETGPVLALEYENAQSAYLMGTPAALVRPTFIEHARATHRPAPTFYAVLASVRLPGPMWCALRDRLRR